jgi:hypothetical protein
MNSNQWFFLGMAIMALGWFFIALDGNSGMLPMPGIEGSYCDLDDKLQLELYQRYKDGEITEDQWLEKEQERILRPLSKYDIKCAVGEEMYEPFIYLTWFGWIVCFIMSFWESKKKKH